MNAIMEQPDEESEEAISSKGVSQTEDHLHSQWGAISKERAKGFSKKAKVNEMLLPQSTSRKS